MVRVLITRPEPGASKTAQRVREMGLMSLVLPLTRIEKLTDIPAVSPADVGAVALTSPNSARHAPPDLVKSLRHLPAYAVGSATAETAREAGFNVVDESAGDAAGLHRAIAAGVEPGAGILILCGRVRRSLLERSLRESGYVPRLVETYDTVRTAPSAEAVAALLGEAPLDAVLLYSAYAADEFVELVERTGNAQAFENACLMVMSGRIRDRLPEAFAGRVAVAEEPNEEAMLSLLRGNFASL